MIPHFSKFDPELPCKGHVSFSYYSAFYPDTAAGQQRLIDDERNFLDYEIACCIPQDYWEDVHRRPEPMKQDNDRTVQEWSWVYRPRTLRAQKYYQEEDDAKLFQMMIEHGIESKDILAFRDFLLDDKIPRPDMKGNINNEWCW